MSTTPRRIGQPIERRGSIDELRGDGGTEVQRASLPRIGAPIQHPRVAGYNELFLPTVALRQPRLHDVVIPVGQTPPTGHPAFGGAQVRFDWQGDRWAHVVRFDGGLGRGREGWHSFEGPHLGGDVRWPASPVFAEPTPIPSRGASP